MTTDELIAKLEQWRTLTHSMVLMVALHGFTGSKESLDVNALAADIAAALREREGPRDWTPDREPVEARPLPPDADTERLTALVREEMKDAPPGPFRPFIVYHEALDRTEILLRDCSYVEEVPSRSGVAILHDNYQGDVVGMFVPGRIENLAATPREPRDLVALVGNIQRAVGAGVAWLATGFFVWKSERSRRVAAEAKMNKDRSAFQLFINWMTFEEPIDGVVPAYLLVSAENTGEKPSVLHHWRLYTKKPGEFEQPVPTNQPHVDEEVIVDAKSDSPMRIQVKDFIANKAYPAPVVPGGGCRGFIRCNMPIGLPEGTVFIVTVQDAFRNQYQCEYDTAERKTRATGLGHVKGWAGIDLQFDRLARPPKEFQAFTPTPAPDGERIYPCDKCGKLRTKAEGGTTFTVCDVCWDVAPPADAPTETRTCGNCKHFDIVCRNATAIGYAAVNLTSDDGCLKGFTPKDGPR